MVEAPGVSQDPNIMNVIHGGYKNLTIPQNCPEKMKPFESLIGIMSCHLFMLKLRKSLPSDFHCPFSSASISIIVSTPL